MKTRMGVLFVPALTQRFGCGQALACGFDGPIEHGDGSGVSGGSGVSVATS
jgi:hypothetical protein